MQILSVKRQIEDGISDELARSVIGDVSPPVHSHDIDAFTGQLFICNEEMMGVGRSPHRNDRLMFREEEQVAEFVRDPSRLQLFLQFPAPAVFRPSEPHHADMLILVAQGQMLIASPYAAAAASITASPNVGCA